MRPSEDLRNGRLASALRIEGIEVEGLRSRDPCGPAAQMGRGRGGRRRRARRQCRLHSVGRRRIARTAGNRKRTTGGAKGGERSAADEHLAAAPASRTGAGAHEDSVWAGCIGTHGNKAVGVVIGGVQTE